MTQKSPQLINRRQFLSKALVGLSLGAGLTTSYGANGGLAAMHSINDGDDVDNINKASNHADHNQNNQPDCLMPTIKTRLFASSNLGVDDARNALSLARLHCAGFDVQNPEVVQRQYLRFAGTDAQRIGDLQHIATGAVTAPKLLLGVRGGYGAMRLLPYIDWQALGQVMQEHGTILAGFSDVTAIQCALLAKGGMSSLAAPMLYSEFGKSTPDKISCQNFVNALTNPNLQINVTAFDPTAEFDVVNNAKMFDGTLSNSIEFTGLRLSGLSSHKTIEGIIWGGNLSVLSALVGSTYLPQPKGGIVFLEDVGEQPYRIERMLYSLYLSGAFKHQQAIVLGAFNGMAADSYDDRYNLDTVVKHLQKLTGLPVLTGLPFGHVAGKHSFPLGAMCRIGEPVGAPDLGRVAKPGFTMTFSGYPTIDAQLINAKALWQ